MLGKSTYNSIKSCEHDVQNQIIFFARAPGEAEAYCAWLDRAGLVDAVVSDDSDCFCYGAKTVLRNFSTDPKNFSVTRCTAKRLREELGLSRQRLVVMALFLGSDYNPGGIKHNRINALAMIKIHNDVLRWSGWCWQGWSGQAFLSLGCPQ